VSLLFDKLLGLVPTWVPFAAAGVLLAALAAGWFFGLKPALEAEGASKVIVADQQAALKQQAKDAALSAVLVADQAAEIASLQAEAQIVITRIDHAPVTTGCGPVMRDASHGVRDLFGGAGAAPSRR
jgi:uncharacterized membrane protein